MKLTDEERRIACRVAWRYTRGGAAFDAAWALATDWIAARRKALGITEEPAPATAAFVGSHEVEVRVGNGPDGTGVPLTVRIVRPATAAGELPTWDADGEEIPPAGVAAMLDRLHRAASALYGHRWTCEPCTLTPAEQAEAWSELRDALCLPPGTATAAGVGGDEPRAQAVGDAAGPANQSPPTTARDCSAAHWCRLNGWGVGTILEGDEGRGPERIVITAVGEEDILAKQIGVPDSERSWVLWCRDWKRVGWHGQYSTVHDGQGDDGTGVPLTARIWGRRETAAGVGADIGTPRGVVVTLPQRDAVKWAAGYIEATAKPWAAVAHCQVEELNALLAAIDAAKGVGHE